MALATGACALLAWVAVPSRPIVGIALIVAGVLHAVRLARWAGDRTAVERLVLVLHVAYAFILSLLFDFPSIFPSAGFLLLGAALLWPQAIAASAGIHAWTTGAVGLMTLAVMTRATLGHTGRPLAASATTQVIYLCALAAALLRVGCGAGRLARDWLHAAGLAWVAAFGEGVVVV